MPSDEVPDDDEIRQTYNFAPGYYGVVYRAIVPDQGAVYMHEHLTKDTKAGEEAKVDEEEGCEANLKETDIHYKLQAMKWGLIPSWTKRNPDYGTMMRTINCRDDSLMENRGMWTSMKKGKRCIVIAQGFYEWLKKNNGKEKIPHYIKRKDGQLMCFAGLWDCVSYEGTQDGVTISHFTLNRIFAHILVGSTEKNYTYTIVTTDANKQMSFLHDRMPVIFNMGSEAIRMWLDPHRFEWTNELQQLLKPFKEELEIYPVSKDVGKVGNNSRLFIVPLDSSENKNNITNFFGKPKPKKEDKVKVEQGDTLDDAEMSNPGDFRSRGKDDSEPRLTTSSIEGTENNAPLPLPVEGERTRIKREHDDDSDETLGPPTKSLKPSSPLKRGSARGGQSPANSPAKSGMPRVRSATSNGTVARPEPPKGNKKITAFFGK
jgi:putative SOS response-associated peptidase YedK